MSDCGCEAPPLDTKAQQRALWIALILNAAMFLIEVGAGLHANSTGLIADGLDMLSDTSAYAIALIAIGRGPTFKLNAARWSGLMLLLLGGSLFLEVVRRFFEGAPPEGFWMIAVSTIALVVNVTVLRLLARHRNGEVHLRAAWIFTRADVVANAAVILSGLAVVVTGMRYFDLIVGAAISIYVIKEALEILKEAREAESSTS